MNKKKIEELYQLSLPYIEEIGYELVDLDFLHEEGRAILRYYIYKEGGVTVDDCEIVSKTMDPLLDEWDPVPTSYYLEVSSPDLSRPLKREGDFRRNIGNEVELRFYKNQDGKKSLVGTLLAADPETVTVEVEGEKRVFQRSEIARLVVALPF